MYSYEPEIVLRNTEINKFHLVCRQQKIVRFDVFMNDAVRMTFTNGLNRLVYVSVSIIGSLFLDIATVTKFHNP